MAGREWRARRRRPPCTREADSFERARRNHSEVRGSAERVWRRGLWRPIIIRRRDGSPRFRPTMVLMPTLGDVFRELNALKEERIVADYALGGATAMLFYAEPTRTYDVDVFVLLARAEGSALVSLGPIYGWARQRGFTEKAEHILIHQVPVQFLPAHNALAEDAVATARTLDYDGVPVRVVGPEHLAALALQAGGGRRRERAWQLLESGSLDRARLDDLLKKHGLRITSGDAG